MFKPNFDAILHFVGIGGIGMSGIAEILLSLGYSVSGSDIAESANVVRLREKGAKIFIGHTEDNVKDASVLVYSSAVDYTNPEMRSAKERNLPIMRRAEMLAELMRLKYGIAIAGTHGKTTTTSLLATILENSSYDPTYIIGGIVSNLKGHAKVGKGDFLVAEADESDGSFLLLNPIMSVVTNIDNDHLDHYGSPENLLSSFDEFVNKIPFYGTCALNAHDERLMEIKKRMKKPFLTFGLGEKLEEQATIEARNVKLLEASSEFDLFLEGDKQCSFVVNLPGEHNILNALGAISLAHRMGIKFNLIAEAIKGFNGVGRRFQSLHKTGKVEVIDDYGHHPTEIAMTLQTLKQTRKNKIIAVFEPHRYSRTRDCWNDFLHCFNDADEVYISPIYPASEKPIPGIESERLVTDINRLHPDLAKYITSLEELDKIISSQEDAVVMTLGAGSIGRKIRDWVLNNDSQ